MERPARLPVSQAAVSQVSYTQVLYYLWQLRKIHDSIKSTTNFTHPDGFPETSVMITVYSPPLATLCWIC